MKCPHFAFIILGYTLFSLKTSPFCKYSGYLEEWAALVSIPAVESTTVKEVAP
jgi:hypothetical protein